MKQIEKYVGYYFLAYLFVLILCGFFQYFTVCQGKSLECNFSIGGINKILTTTATVLTPIIAIIGYLSWRNQETYKKSQELIDLCIDKIRDLQISWHESREYGEVSRFQYYLARGILGTENLDDVKLLDDLVFLIDKLYHEIKNDFTALENAIDNVEYMLNKNLEDLLVFHQQLVIIKYGDNFTLKSENEMREICKRLDRYCDQFMGGNKDDIKYDYKNDINESLLKISKEILKIKKEI
ncbi:hypothetical protein [Acinetobacter baumannii]|uniref:hypothetical protein n=1 Tax=Acinetobacter baumannii TaxID=470 RepID=UPI001D1784E5|nr:hypothetical protein [Acinetobacter baumannii]